MPGNVSQNPEQLGELEPEQEPWVAAYGWQEVALAGEWAGTRKALWALSSVNGAIYWCIRNGGAD